MYYLISNTVSEWHLKTTQPLDFKHFTANDMWEKQNSISPVTDQDSSPFLLQVWQAFLNTRAAALNPYYILMIGKCSKGYNRSERSHLSSFQANRHGFQEGPGARFCWQGTKRAEHCAPSGLTHKELKHILTRIQQSTALISLRIALYAQIMLCEVLLSWI